MKKLQKIFFSIIVIFVVLGLVAPTKSHAIDCGDVLGPFGFFVLNQDLNCTQMPALTLVGPATLDLNGHTVRCVELYNEELEAMVGEIESMVESNEDPEIIAEKVKTMSEWIVYSFDEGSYVGGIGIAVEGTFALLKNGTVMDCDFGVNVEGDGKNSVTKVNSINNIFGISTFSQENWIGFNTALGNTFGINAFSKNNKFEGNKAENNGFAINAFSDNNWFGLNHAYSNGFGINAFSKNNKFEGNKAENNGFGHAIFADKNWLKSNSAYGNGFGFAVFNDFNLLLLNIAKNNGFGVFVDGQNNTIKFNKALNNSTKDLFDDNTNCDNNFWRFNIFKTRNLSCIQ